MTIRKRRRDRTRNRINNQKRLDAIAHKELNGNIWQKHREYLDKKYKENHG